VSDLVKHNYSQESKAWLIERLTRLEERETAHQSQFVNFIDASLLAIQIVTKRGDALYTNDAYVKLFGFTDKEGAQATSQSSLVAPHDLERVRTNSERRHSPDNASLEYEYDALKKDGTTFPAQIFIQSVIWNAQQAFQCVYVDLTERKRTANEIDAKSALLQNIFDATPDFLSIRDVEGRFKFVNDNLAAELKMTPTDAVGKSPSDIYGENTGATVEALTKEVINSGQPVFTTGV
jgi:HTH-type transcriptional regulator, bacterioopsin transcriptional activator and related proteins